MGRNPLYLRLFGIILICFLFLGCGRTQKTATPRDPNYINAVELKLKFRELADQLLATMPSYGIQGYVGMPVSFVDQNFTRSSSPLGRLISESMFFEFNQRGYPTREYRLTGNIEVRGARDNLVLVPSKDILANQSWAAILLGTYCVDEDATFINARLVRAKDGLVMRTAQLVLVNTPIIQRLGKSDSAGYDYFDPYQDNMIYDPLRGMYVPGRDVNCGNVRMVQVR